MGERKIANHFGVNPNFERFERLKRLERLEHAQRVHYCAFVPIPNRFVKSATQDLRKLRELSPFRY
jgi:hypothetical protein